MHAVILAGGEGRRLLPHTELIPKPLVPIGDQPVIALVLSLLAKTGVRSVDIAVNHQANQIIDTLGDGSQFGLKIKYCHEPSPLSTIGPLTLIDNLPEQFLVLNADVLTDMPFNSFFESHVANQMELSVATTVRTEKTDFGVLETDEQRGIVGFREKPQIELTVSMGIYAMNRSLVSGLKRGARFGFDDLMHQLLREKRSVRHYPWNGYWLDIGRPDDYEKAKTDAALYRSWLAK